jgi:hypothetical protein
MMIGSRNPGGQGDRGGSDDKWFSQYFHDLSPLANTGFVTHRQITVFSYLGLDGTFENSILRYEKIVARPECTADLRQGG